MNTLKTKGGLISECFTLWLQSPKNVPNHYPELFPPKEDTSDLVHSLGDWNKCGNLSEIKPPLPNCNTLLF